MGFKAGIVGLPNVGKSTLFNAVTAAKAEAANYPFCTIEPNVGVIGVPDPRLDALKALVNPEKVVPAAVQIVDIAGLVRGASKGEGLGNQFLANIRECEAILHVLRCFENDNIVHVEGKPNPIRDKEIIETELQLKDLESLEKRLDKARKSAKSGDKDAKAEVDLLERIQKHLEQGKSIRLMEVNATEAEYIASCYFLTNKKVMYVCNIDENTLHEENDYVKQVKAMAETEGAGVVVISAELESQISLMSDPDERAEFLEALGISEPGLSVLIRSAYQLLGLQTYFTAGKKEVRAWTILAETRAPQAAGVIHSDFERGFIRAEVIKFEDFVTYKNEEAVKSAGKLMVVGKDYVVHDGDILHFRFNV